MSVLNRKIKYALPAMSMMLAFFASACETDVKTTASTVVSSTGIIGGVETNYDSWQSAVMVQAHDVLCSGTLIHRRVVLTAGHCVLLDDPDFGSRDYTGTPSRIAIWGGPVGDVPVAGVSEVAVHPEWVGTVDYTSPDLALLLLDRDVADLEPYRLRDFPSPEVEDPGILVGYGDDGAGGAGVHRMGYTIIQHVDARYISLNGDAATCGGDSGGPLFTQQGGEWVVTAVTSLGLEACSASAVGYSINLLSYCGWLNDTMVDFTGDDLGLEGCTSCDAVRVETWGDPCGPGYPCCPEGTICRRPDEYSDNDLGYCGPACCGIESADPMYCTDVTSGEERCSFSNDQGEAFCAIHCDDDGDCVPGTVCRNKPFESEKICIAREQGPGAIIDCDAADGDFDGDSDDAGENAGGSGDTAACGCDVPGGGATDVSIFFSVLTIIENYLLDMEYQPSAN